MEAPVFAQKLGRGSWIGTRYVLEQCPICSGLNTMMFTGKGMWGCAKCKKGGMDLDSFREHLGKDEMAKTLLPSIKNPERPEELIVLADYKTPFVGTVIGTGFGGLDYLLGGLNEGGMTIITGKSGEGKSTFLGQLSLNAIQANHHVCFYSGELSAGRFQNWMFSQAAGSRNMRSFQDPFGAIRWAVSSESEQKIRPWLGDRLVLYDNTKVKASERQTILRSFQKARAYYGSDLFIVDNLMTAKFDIDNAEDSNRAQANFAASMMDFARSTNVHVILVAHPKKGEYDDIKEGVSGLLDITNMASNVIQVRKVKDEDRGKEGCDSIVTVAKNREYGDLGKISFNFDAKSKRFIPAKGSCISKYGWEDLK